MWLNIASTSFVSGSKYIISSGGQTRYVSRGGIAVLIQNFKLYITVRHGQSGLHWKVTHLSVPQDTWFHLGFTWSQQNGLTIFINGVKMAEIGSITYSASSSKDGSGGILMQLGKPNTNSANTVRATFYIDEWYFWENTLLTEHMSSLYGKYNMGKYNVCLEIDKKSETLFV